jgi:hypothetical protein
MTRDGMMGNPKTASECSTADKTLGRLLSDGAVRILDRQQLPTPPSALKVFWSRHPVLHESLCEIRNCCQRISLLCRQGRVSRLQMGFLYLRSDPEGLRPNTTRLGRIESREKLLSVRPWASLQDQQFFLCGWELGREWALGHLGDRGEETSGYSHSSEQLLGELAGNSRPLLEVRQSTNGTK